MRWNCTALLLALVAASGVPLVALEAGYHHVHLTATNAEEGAQWYIKNMGCQAVAGRPERALCGSTLFLFAVRQPTGPSDGTAVNHIGFSFSDVPAKVKALESAGVKITMAARDVPNLFKIAFVEDPWGTRIELVEDPKYPGFHHIHLSSPDPEKTLSWYQNVFGGQRTKLRGQLDAVLCCDGKLWLLANRAASAPAPIAGRAIDHLGFSFSDLKAAALEMKEKGVQFKSEPRAVTTPSATMTSFVIGPDGVDIEVVQPVQR